MQRSARGSSLITALVVLAAMSMAAVALVQAVDASLQLARNASFQRDASNRNEIAIRQGIREFRDVAGARFAALANTNDHASATGIPLPYRASAPEIDPNITDACREGTDRAGVPWAMRTDPLAPLDRYAAFKGCFGNGVLASIRIGPTEGMETVWMIERLCDGIGAFDPAHCVSATPRANDTCSRCQPVRSPLAPAFRITARTLGPRGTDVVAQVVFSLPIE